MNQQIRDNLAYHYTSLETALKIIEGVRDGSFIFHASSIFCLNDPTEMKYGYERVMEIFPKIENMLGIFDDKYRLSKLWEKDKRFSPVEWQEIYLSMMEKHLEHAFVISLSKNRDSLPMWTRYGDNGQGIAFGFDTRIYIKQGNELEHDIFSTPCSIDVEYGNISYLNVPSGYVKYEYQNYWKRAKAIKDEDKILDLQLNAISNILIYGSTFVKHQAYADENESRIIKRHERIEDVKFKYNGIGRIISYVDVALHHKLLKEIIIGPCCDYDMVKRCIEIFLQQKGINHDIEVSKSTVPYRR